MASPTSPAPRVPLDVGFVTFHDDNLPGSNVVDYKNPNSFVLTTGSFPQEVVVHTRAASARFSRITVTLDEAKDIVLERCSANNNPANSFEVFAERTLERGAETAPQKPGSALPPAARPGSSRRLSKQIEVFDLDPSSAGKDVKAIRLKILSGYSEFVGVHCIEAWGEESQQRIAVLESKPEVNM